MPVNAVMTSAAFAATTGSKSFSSGTSSRASSGRACAAIAVSSGMRASRDVSFPSFVRRVRASRRGWKSFALTGDSFSSIAVVRNSWTSVRSRAATIAGSASAFLSRRNGASAASRTLSFTSYASFSRRARSPAATAAWTAYIRTHHDGCVTKAPIETAAVSGARSASATNACVSRCQALTGGVLTSASSLVVTSSSSLQRSPRASIAARTT